jgi:hypothetical protein
MIIFTWILSIVLLLTLPIAWRAMRRGPVWPGRIALLIAFFLLLFPWARSWLSNDGRGDFNPMGAIAGWEWLLIVCAFAPILGVCLFVISVHKVPPAPAADDAP